MPTIYVIAGPNGIGKTTASSYLIPHLIAIINPDEIAKQARLAGLLTGNAQEYSNREAIRLMNEQRQQQNSFAIETNLADTDTWKFLLDIQKTGYHLHLLFLSTDNIALLNKRIETRVQLGEHFVTPGIVWERYINGLKLLNHYLAYPDTVELFDNSIGLLRMALIHKGAIKLIQEDLPAWIGNTLTQRLQSKENDKKPIRDMSIEEIRNTYKEKNKGSNKSTE